MLVQQYSKHVTSLAFCIRPSHDMDTEYFQRDMLARVRLGILAQGVFQLESCEDFQAFSRNHFSKIPRKAGGSIRAFRSQIVR